MAKTERIPDEYWDKTENRFNSHAYFRTINHRHISDYSGKVTCDLMMVECEDGRWYIEDNWGGDAQGSPDVFNPFDKDSFPTFYPDLETCNRRAAEIVSSITGCKVDDLIIED